MKYTKQNPLYLQDINLIIPQYTAVQKVLIKAIQKIEQGIKAEDKTSFYHAIGLLEALITSDEQGGEE